MNKTTLLLIFAVFGVTLCTANEIATVHLIKDVMNCTKDHKVEPQHLMSLQKHILPNDPATKCLLACAYRKENVLDDKGMYSIEGSLNFAEKMYGDDAVKLETAKKVILSCAKVNDEPVDDGDKGCERSGLMFTCLIDNSVKVMDSVLKIMDNALKLTDSTLKHGFKI